MKLAIGLFIFTACKQPAKQDQVEHPQEELTDNKEVAPTRDPRKIGPAKSESQYKIEENIFKINEEDDPLYGYWVGSFGKNKIIELGT